MGEPAGTRRGRPREEVEWMRRVSSMTWWRLYGKVISEVWRGMRKSGRTY